MARPKKKKTRKKPGPKPKPRGRKAKKKVAPKKRRRAKAGIKVKVHAVDTGNLRRSIRIERRERLPQPSPELGPVRQVQEYGKRQESPQIGRIIRWALALGLAAVLGWKGYHALKDLHEGGRPVPTISPRK